MELAHDYSTSRSGIVPRDQRRSLYHFVAIWITFAARPARLAATVAVSVPEARE
jgi:hypothetical protein